MMFSVISVWIRSMWPLPGDYISASLSLRVKKCNLMKELVGKEMNVTFFRNVFASNYIVMDNVLIFDGDEVFSHIFKFN